MPFALIEISLGATYVYLVFSKITVRVGTSPNGNRFIAS